MRAGDIVNLSPDGAYLCCLAAVETDAFVEHAAAHGLFLYVVVVAANHRFFLFAFLFGNCLEIFVNDSGERVGAPVLVGRTGLCYGVCLVVAFVMDILAEILVICLVAIFTFDSLTGSLGKLDLSLALHLDRIMGGFERVEKIGFRNFLHLALDHHDIVVCGADHELHVGLFELLESGIDDKFAVHTGHTHFRDRAVEGNVADSDCSRSGKSGQSVGHILAVGGIESYVYESVSVVIVREKRTQNTVNESGSQYFVIRSAPLAFEESAGETSERGVFFLIFNL